MQLNDSNFLFFAAKHYDNRNCQDVAEFYKDIEIVVHLKKLFTRYHTTGILKHRLAINHIICFCNVFDNLDAARKILFYKIEPKYHIYLKTFLIHLDRMSETQFTEVPVDIKLLKALAAAERNAEES